MHEKNMPITGIGPRMFRLILIYCAAIISAAHFGGLDHGIKSIPPRYLHIAGTILILIGALYLALSIVTLKNAYKAGRLCTSGVYSMCRNPLYSAWIVFIIPGIMLLLDSWLLLTVPFFMYIALRALIKEEEEFLSDKFGKEYGDYNKKVPLILPAFWKYKK